MLNLEMVRNGGIKDLWAANLQRANLRKANLWAANLQRANLRKANLWAANLQEANLQAADLRGVNLDFSCLPLWCGSLGMIIDKKLAQQLLAHVFNISKQFCKPTPEQVKFVNGAKRVLSGDIPKL